MVRPKLRALYWASRRAVTIKLQEKDRPMPGDVITIVILLLSVRTLRSDHIKGGVSAERLEKITNIDTSVSCWGICVRIALGFHGNRRQCEQLIIAVIKRFCAIPLRIKGDHLEILPILTGLGRLKGCRIRVACEQYDDERSGKNQADNRHCEGK